MGEVVVSPSFDVYSGLDMGTELDELMLHPDAGKILSRIAEDERRDDARHTSRFYQHFILNGGRKELGANLAWRRSVIESCRGSKGHELRGLMRTICSRDLLFWLNTFAWTYDPRNKGGLTGGGSGIRKLPKTVPFITWDYQDDAFKLLQWCITNGVDAIIEKSRDMGASWVFLAVFDWFFLFHEQNTFMMVSRKEDLVDKKGDPDSLFWKVNFIHENLPGWMMPDVMRQKLHFENHDMGSTLDGEATTGDVARGGRRTAIGMDEFAAVPRGEDQNVIDATNDSTECRIFNSTPKGCGNAYHEQTKRDNIVRVRMHWSQHPHKRRGLYFCQKGQCPIHPDGGHAHSPWYDYECRRRGYNTVAIGQELDIDYSMSGGVFFNDIMMEQYSKKYGRHNAFKGELSFEPAIAQPYGFHEQPGGQLTLWFQPAIDDTVPLSRYVIACDISEGTGASFSCASIGDAVKGEKVGRLMSSLMKPYEFARYVVALARKFCSASGEPAYLIWEANGPGREFGDEIVTKLGFNKVFRRRSIIGEKKRAEFPGWYSTEEEKISAFGAYRRALAEETLINRDNYAIKEAQKYITNDKGVPEYRGEGLNLNKVGQSHGDIVVADVLLQKGIEDLKIEGISDDDDNKEPEHIPNCLGARMENYYRDEQEKKSRWW